MQKTPIILIACLLGVFFLWSTYDDYRNEQRRTEPYGKRPFPRMPREIEYSAERIDMKGKVRLYCDGAGRLKVVVDGDPLLWNLFSTETINDYSAGTGYVRFKPGAPFRRNDPTRVYAVASKFWREAFLGALEKPEPLGTRQIDGHVCDGWYEYRVTGGFGPFQLKVADDSLSRFWFDRETGWLVLLENADPNSPKLQLTSLSRKPVDEAVFSTK